MAPTITTQNPIPEEELRGYYSAGMHGHVVGKATREGGISGFDPQAKRKVRVVTNQETNSGFEVDLAAISADDTKAIMAGGQLFKSNQTEEEFQAAQVEAFRRMATLAERRKSVPPSPAAAVFINPAANASAPAVPSATQVAPSPWQIHPAAQPVPTFAPPVPSVAPVTHPVAAEAPPPVRKEASVPAPAPIEEEFHVTFEIDPKLGRIEAPYYEVLKYDDRLVLVIRKLAGGRRPVRYFPPVSEELVLVDVEQHPDVYAVRSLGLTFEFARSRDEAFEFCVLLIEHSRPRNDSPPIEASFDSGDDSFPEDLFAPPERSDR